MSHVLIAPDKFKGTLTAAQVAAAVGRGLTDARPDAPAVELPVADGGDGTLDAAVAAGFVRVPVWVSGPVGNPVESAYAVRDGVAVLEMADACGLTRLPEGRLAPMTASSTGLGQLIRAALDAGVEQIILGVGGSASTDGGAGLMTALGARLLDAAGNDVAPGGGALSRLDRVELAGLHPRLAHVRMVLAGDVDNPLLGPHGAAATYGPQKGASAAQVQELDAALARWSNAVASARGRLAGDGGRTAIDIPGAGAAGGVGFAAIALLGAESRAGIDLFLELTGFYAHLVGAALVITGEGSLDIQTLRGKAPAGVAAAAGRAGVPVVAVAGRNELGPVELAAGGFAAAYALSDLEADVARCLADPAPLLEQLGARIAADWLPAAAAGRPLLRPSSSGSTSTPL
jgi:glycerate kinase